MNLLSYNRGNSDQYYQRYFYDADNRITEVSTSADGFIWKRDAQYSYYEHGPLARIQLSRPEVQGVDYAYTIQGWLKAMNTDTLNGNLDMGMDGLSTSVTARDAVAHTIDYFKNDYTSISGRQIQHVTPTGLSLYNGNIARQTEAIANFQKLNKQYVYDQLNRINSASYASVSSIDNTLTGLNAWSNRYSYDKDGNILSLIRYGNDTGSGVHLMDSLTYVYTSPHDDKLMEVYDNAADYYANDIRYYPSGAMPARYRYDPIGNTTKDLVSGQDTIEWNLYNKVVYTQNNTGSNFMNFDYDGAGNRVAKYYTKVNDTGNTVNADYYVRDAQGNILAIYHENDVYRMLPAFWLHGVDAELRSALGSSSAFDESIVMPLFSKNGDFQKAIEKYGKKSKDVMSYVYGIPVSTYIGGNKSLYQRFMFSDPGYVPALAQADLGTKQRIIGPALEKYVANDPKLAIIALGGLLADSIAGPHALELVCGMHGGEKLMGRLAQEYCDSAIVTTDCDSLRNIIVTDSLDPYVLAQSLLKIIRKNSTDFGNYLELIGTDSLFYADSALAPALTGFIQQVLVTYGNKKDLLAFFDSYPNSMQMLQQIMKPKQLLKVAYNLSPDRFLSVFNNSLGDDYVDSCIAKVRKLDFRSYLSLTSSILGTTVLAGPPITGMDVNAMTLQNFWLAEHDIYGSSRLGTKTYDKSQVGLTWKLSSSGGAYTDTIRMWHRQPWYSLEYQDNINQDSLLPYGNVFTGQMYAQHILGQKQYELTDHLGNVLATVSDKRANDSMVAEDGSAPVAGAPALVNTWKPVVVTAHDYYPFGSYMPGRYSSDTGCNCFTTTLEEMVPTVVYEHILPYPAYTTGAITVTGSAGISPATATGAAFISVTKRGDGISYDMTNLPANEKIVVAVELPLVQGVFQIGITDDSTGKLLGSTTVGNTQGAKNEGVKIPFMSLTGSATLSILALNPGDAKQMIGNFMDIPDTSTELTNKPPYSLTSSIMGGFIIATIGFPKDTVVEKSVATIVCEKDFYRFGYNGQMKVNEIAGLGNHTTALFWDYDTRIGRRWNVDPVVKIPFSPYSSFSCDPISRADPNGDDDFFSSTGRFLRHTVGGTHIQIVDGKQTVLFSKYLTDQTHSSLDRATTALGIANHYAPEAGVHGNVGLGLNINSPNSPAHTKGNKVEINAFFSPNNYKYITDYGNVINILHHEGEHQEEGEVRSYADHAKVYLGQILDKSFTDGTTEDYRRATIGSFAKYVMNSYVQDPNSSDATELINDFNKNNKAGYSLSTSGGLGNAESIKITISSKNGSSTMNYEKMADSN